MRKLGLVLILIILLRWRRPIWREFHDAYGRPPISERRQRCWELCPCSSCEYYGSR